MPRRNEISDWFPNRDNGRQKLVDDILKVLGEKTVNQMSKTSKMKVEKKTSLDKWRLGEFVPSILALYEILKEILWTKKNGIRH